MFVFWQPANFFYQCRFTAVTHFFTRVALVATVENFCVYNLPAILLKIFMCVTGRYNYTQSTLSNNKNTRMRIYNYVITMLT